MKTRNYKIVIPCAGTGSRLGNITKDINKALVTVGDLPVIARIIRQFPHDVEFIILLGYKGKLVKQVVDVLFPNHQITYVDVDRYEGPGSGLGYSLKKAKHLLQTPFIFIPNDTIVQNQDINLDPTKFGNWIGYSLGGELFGGSRAQYRGITKDQNHVLTKVLPKDIDSSFLYTGICGIFDYEAFWDAMENDQAVDVGEAYGINSLKNVTCHEIENWFDCGNQSELKRARRSCPSQYNILDKNGEAIWFMDQKVVKFSLDEKFIHDRIKRTEYLHEELIPRLTATTSNTYSYDLVNGQTLSKYLTPSKTQKLLKTMDDKIWREKSPPTKDQKDQLILFYKNKTFDRLNHYLMRFEKHDFATTINGTKVEKTTDLLAKVDWEELTNNSLISGFHGDFHNENILETEENNFVLIDWRQNFFSNTFELGDLYYDLAKFNHGLEVNHGIVDSNLYAVREQQRNEYFIQIAQLSNLTDIQHHFFSWINENGYSVRQVKLLTALIYINICGLHDAPYSEFLYNWGRLKLKHILSE